MGDGGDNLVEVKDFCVRLPSLVNAVQTQIVLRVASDCS